MVYQSVDGGDASNILHPITTHVDAEEQNEMTLLQVLEAEGVYDTELGQAKRQHALNVLEEWLCEWSDSLLPGRKAALHKKKKRRLATTTTTTSTTTATQKCLFFQ
mmetsp:Transcript_18491/g.33502  ORF Transcript_18491/g.33502 Transcript_18491/m.33502 type:complete len:106 (+) Transcript_18491:122-439(+)